MDSQNFSPDTQHGEACDDLAVPASPDDGDDAFADNAVRYYQAKAEVARLAVELGIPPEGGPGAKLGAKLGAAATAREGAPTGFGRGWIPVSRDIGLPGEGPGVSGWEEYGRHSQSAVAPAEAGAHPDHEYRNRPRSNAQGWDGPLPAQGRRQEEESGAIRTIRPTDFTPGRRAEFLHVLAEKGNVRLVCARIGVSRETAYLARRRDAVFRAGWDAAMVHARVHSEQVLADHALEGTPEAVWYRGERIGEKVKVDARLLLAHLARLDRRCEDPQVLAHAERFDEILALVAGAQFPAAMHDRAERGCDAAEPDPILPMERERYVREGGFALERGGEDAEEEDPSDDGYVDPQQAAQDAIDAAMWAAQDRAEEEWEAWERRVEAVCAALEAGELPVLVEQAGDGASGDEDTGEAEEEAPFEVKSLDGVMGLFPHPTVAPAWAGATGRAGRRRYSLPGLCQCVRLGGIAGVSQPNSSS